MSQELTILRPLCARNAGFALAFRVCLVSLILFSLNTLFIVPGEATLSAAAVITTNVLFLLILIVAVVILLFSSLITAIPLHNGLKTINMNVSKAAAVSRLIETLFFTLSLVLLCIGVPFFNLVFLISHFSYGLTMVFLGTLAFKSGYLSKVLGIFLIIGGFSGYLIEGVIHLLLPDYAWVPTAGIVLTTVAEVILGIAILRKALDIINGRSDPKETITTILKIYGEATTEEIAEKASQVSPVCKDRVPGTLVSLEEDKRITKRISREKKALVWSLVDQSPTSLT
ncbi:MAG: DUF4386 domain-containing protein [Candidatus Odinarchaeota archaeon]